MKKYLATVAAMALFLTSTSVAMADEGTSSSSAVNGAYVGVLGGANWDDVISSPYVDNKTGYVIGAVVGTHVRAVPGLRLEAELSDRLNEVDLCGGYLTADHETLALMGNVVYDLPVKVGPFQPYALAGLGWAQSTATFEDVSIARAEASGVAWQLGAGVNTEIAEGITAGVGYRYFQGPEIEVFGNELSDGSNHAVLATVNFAL